MENLRATPERALADRFSVVRGLWLPDNFRWSAATGLSGTRRAHDLVTAVYDAFRQAFAAGQW